MKRTIQFLLLSVLAIFSGCGIDDFQDGKTELDGTWDLVTLERDGKEVQPHKDTRAIFAGDRFVIKVGEKVVAGGTFKVDSTKKPKAITAIAVRTHARKVRSLAAWSP